MPKHPTNRLERLKVKNAKERRRAERQREQQIKTQESVHDDRSRVCDQQEAV